MKSSVAFSETSVDPRELLAFFNEAATDVGGPVSPRDAAQLARTALGCPFPEELVKAALERSPRFARIRGQRYVTREVACAGARLRVQPDAFEVSRGVLFSGHRFLPLWSGEELDAVILRDPGGEPIPHTGVPLSVTQALPYHHLLGFTWMSVFINDTAQCTDTQAPTFHAFDLRACYERWRFMPGDFLLLEIRDPWSREVTVHHQPRSEVCRMLDRVRAADVALERALKIIARHPFVVWAIAEQLFHAFAAAPAFVRRHPGSPFDQFLRRTGALSLQEVGQEMAVFPRGVSPFTLALERSRAETCGGDPFVAPADRLFNRLGLALRSPSLRGIMRLGAARKRSLAETIDRLVPWNRLQRCPAEDLKALRSCLNGLWDEARRAELAHPMPPDVCELFTRSAAIKEHVREILNHLGRIEVEPSELPSHPMMRIVEIDEMADHLLQIDASLAVDSERVAELSELMKDLSENLNTLGQELYRGVRF